MARPVKTVGSRSWAGQLKLRGVPAVYTLPLYFGGTLLGACKKIKIDLPCL